MFRVTRRVRITSYAALPGPVTRPRSRRRAAPAGSRRRRRRPGRRGRRTRPGRRGRPSAAACRPQRPAPGPAPRPGGIRSASRGRRYQPQRGVLRGLVELGPGRGDQVGEHLDGGGLGQDERVPAGLDTRTSVARGRRIRDGRGRGRGGRPAGRGRRPRLVEDRLQVVLHRVAGQVQPAGDLGGRSPRATSVVIMRSRSVKRYASVITLASSPAGPPPEGRRPDPARRARRGPTTQRLGPVLIPALASTSGLPRRPAGSGRRRPGSRPAAQRRAGQGGAAPRSTARQPGSPARPCCRRRAPGLGVDGPSPTRPSTSIARRTPSARVGASAATRTHLCGGELRSTGSAQQRERAQLPWDR